ncbi:MAG: DHH family phosphoesterase [Candidatus Helarchaeota archaeon]
MKELLKFILNLEPKSILITNHINSDPDGLCSAMALQSLLKDLGINSEIKFYSESFTFITKKIIEKLDLNNMIINDISDFRPDLIFLIDVSNLEIIGTIKSFIEDGIPFIIIDHHYYKLNKNYRPIFSIIKEGYSSTAEIIYELFELFGIELKVFEGINLLLGILYDTKHFYFAKNKTFSIVSKILSLEIDYDGVLKLLRYPLDKSEKIARIKAANRARSYIIGDWVILTSEVSSYEASACRGLLNLGADIAIVKSSKKNELRISLRSSKQFYDETNISMSDICIELANLYNNIPNIGLTGGGHSTAAGINANTNVSKINEEIIELIKRKLRK